MADEIHLDAGDNASDVVAGKGNQQSRQQANPRQTMRGGANNYYNGDNSQQWIIAQILDHAQQLRELTRRLDDLPNKFIELKGRFDVQVEKVERLEDLEVVVRKEDVVIRAATPPEATTISNRTLTLALMIISFLLLSGLLYLIYIQAGARG